MIKPSLAQRRQWSARAETLAKKSAELFTLIEGVLGDDDVELVPFVGDTMCSAAELANMLELDES